MVQDQCSFFSLSHQHSCVSCHPAAFPEVLTGIEILTSCAGFCHDQQPPFKAVCRESTRREKSAEVFLNFRAVLIQTYIKAFRHQTSLLQCLGEHFHFKPRKLNIFQGNFFYVIYINIKHKRRRSWGTNMDLCCVWVSRKDRVSVLHSLVHHDLPVCCPTGHVGAQHYQSASFAFNSLFSQWNMTYCFFALTLTGSERKSPSELLSEERGCVLSPVRSAVRWQGVWGCREVWRKDFLLY